MGDISLTLYIYCMLLLLTIWAHYSHLWILCYLLILAIFDMGEIYDALCQNQQKGRETRPIYLIYRLLKLLWSTIRETWK